MVKKKTVLKRFAKKFPLITKPVFWVNFLSGFIMMAIVLKGYFLYQGLTGLVKTQNERARIQREISYWQTVLNRYQGYRDGFYRKAVLEYKLGNFKDAQKDLDKALSLDPGFKPGYVLAQKINE